MRYRKLLSVIGLVCILSISWLANVLVFAEAAATPEITSDHAAPATGIELASAHAVPPQAPLLAGSPILTITTTANPTSVNEPGGSVSFSVSLTNTTAVTNITVMTLTDSLLGSLSGQGTCSTGQVLTPGQSYSCSFSRSISGNANENIINTVTATVQYDGSLQDQASDGATVAILDILPSITVRKDNNANTTGGYSNSEQAPAGGATVSFRVMITNNTAEAVTITSISDNLHGSNASLTGGGSPTCASQVGATLAGNSTITCFFNGTIANDDDLIEVNTVTVNVSDDEGGNDSKSDTSTVTTPDLLPSIFVNASVNPGSVPEAGNNVNFTVQIVNFSTIDPVTINSLTDDLIGNLHNQGTCSVPQVIAPGGGSYQCIFSHLVSGDFPSVINDQIVASGTDDDSNPVSNSDQVFINITNSPSSMNVIKTANPTSIPEPGGNINFTVRVNNTSAADSITIGSNDMIDDLYGNLNGQGTCSLPKTIAPGSNYQCNFTKAVSGNAGDVINSDVEVDATDDDGEEPSGDNDDDAPVTITDLPSSITVSNSASPTWVPEPGGDINYTVRIDNTSAADTVTVNSIIDDINGDLSSQGCATGQNISPGGFYQCTFMATVSGLSGQLVTNEITINVTDDDSNTFEEEDDATVTIVDKVIFSSYLPVLSKPAPTILSVKNLTTGNVTFIVRHFSSGAEITRCTVSSGATIPCDHNGDNSHIFPPGLYNVEVAANCGSNIFPKAYGSGPVTTDVFCN